MLTDLSQTHILMLLYNWLRLRLKQTIDSFPFLLPPDFNVLKVGNLSTKNLDSSTFTDRAESNIVIASFSYYYLFLVCIV
jgi:hypothetical protein